MIPNIPSIKNPERYADFELKREKLEYALSEAIKKIDFALPSFTDRFPDHASVNNVYQPTENTWGWHCGFWTGILWHAYELTGDEKYKNVALSFPSPHKTRKFSFTYTSYHIFHRKSRKKSCELCFLRRKSTFL